MTFDEACKAVDGIPYLGRDEGWELYRFVLDHRPEACLELGHAHGVASIYLAAAMEAVGAGTLDSVDLDAAAGREPNLETLLRRTGLGHRVNIHREANSYTWFLKRKIEAQTQADGTCRPCYDFAFIDGAKNWTIDGLAFFLVDKLLRPGGWILFDDYKWTYGKHKHREVSDGITIRELGAEELEQPHIERIFRLLVMQHPAYANFEVQDDWWAWAQKAGGSRALKSSRMSWHLRGA